ncbi:MAG: recombination regulator RecX [Oscillospiraceae bacterium]|nr:recombination regulator RecX [Oscillospiraceae bacterium]
MVIEEITQTKNKPGWFTALFEDGTVIKVSVEQLADYGLYQGLELPDDEYRRLRAELEFGASKTRALRILGSRTYSSREIERRLTNKGESRETAARTVQWLEEIGAINDKEYAASIVEHYRSKGYGLAKIREELFRRGIPGDIWDEAIGDFEIATDATLDFLMKKLSGSRENSEQRVAINALRARGFSYEDAQEVWRKYMENTEEIENEQ